MGTRADFYVGKGPEAEWLGSTHWDGHPDGFRRRDNTGLFDQPNATEGEWRENVTVMLAGRDDSCTPEQGWPWPWDDSDTTDYAYTWTEDGRVEYTYCDKWVKANEAGDEDSSYWDTWCARGRPNAKHANWPDMSARRDPDAGYGPGAHRVGRIVIM